MSAKGGKTSGRSAKVAGKAATRQAAAKDASGRIDRMIANLGDWRGERLAEIRKLIHEVDPEVVEDWKWMGTPVWSHEGMYALANPHKGKVKLTFLHGARLPDPKNLFNAGLGGNKWRAIDIFEGDKIDKAALKALLRAAVAYNTRHSKPILLSGGNPQIAKADGDAPVRAYIEAMPGWKSAAGRRLDALIERTVPGVRKAVRWNSPFYGVEGRGWFLAFHCFTKYIKVTFLRGTSLRPLPPVESRDPNTRYVHIHEDDPLDEAQLAKWIRQAAALPGWIP